MYYVKDANGNHICLGEATVYSTCPRCGAEHVFNELWDLVGYDYDLYSDALCEPCSKKWRLEQKAMERGLHLVTNDLT